MKDLELLIDDRMDDRFADYPPHVLPKLIYLRRLIIQCAEELPSISKVEETLKWGEPSYLTKKGSTIRIDWKEKAPDRYSVYFKCTSQLVPIFRALYGDLFSFENNRAIHFSLEEKVPIEELKKCIKMALEYHTLKHLPNLGAF